jgi:hypothetical protein
MFWPPFVFAGIVYRWGANMQKRDSAKLSNNRNLYRGNSDGETYWREPETIADVGATSFRSAK